MVVWGLLTALVAGINFRFSPLFLLPVALFASLMYRRLARDRCAWVILLLPLLFWYGQHSACTLRENTRYVDNYFSSGAGAKDITVDGWVSGFPRVGGGRTSFRFDAGFHGRTFRLLVYTNAPGIDYGDSLRLTGKLLKRRGREPRQDPDVDPYLFSKGAAGTLKVKRYQVTVLPGTDGSWLQRCVFWPWHDRLRQEIVRRLAGNSGIPLALLLGERGELSKSIRRIFIELGISHLLALSGMHLGLIAAAILLLLRRFRARKLLPLLFLLTVYLGTVGEVLSLYRAFGMAVFLVLAKMLHRPMDAMRALAMAVFLLVLWSPHIYFSVGFQLSVTATFAVLLCVKSIPLWRTKKLAARLLNYAVGTIYVGIFVQVFIAPLLLHYFDRISVVSPIATLIFFPFVFIVLFLSILCALSGCFCAELADVFACILAPVNEAFVWLLLYAKGVTPPLLHLPHADILFYCAGITLIWRSRRLKRRLVLGAFLILLSFLKPILLATINS
jgi:competence protein ComEC